ncbi:hypothetical protein NDU88_008329 [Pleurodeles waltl]|uniref:Uncharacterized protein n=1 Tax=Pleurodeles waltl TaxID=8319 RepID=A0AAV7QRF5_PLEWA|nr:hypothetical protein NDU88_008329 [Pleurodeles waltl]
MSSTNPLGLCSVPRSLLSRVISSLWVPGLYQHHRQPAHSVAPSAPLGALSDALQRIFCQAGLRPPFHVPCKSPGSVLRASFLVPECYFLVVGAGPVPTPPADSALPQRTRALYPMHYSVFSARPGVTSSLWVPGLYRHCQRPAHSVAPLALTGTLSDTLQRVLCQAETAPQRPLHVRRPVLRTSLLVLQRYFLVVGAGPHRHRWWTAHSVVPPVRTGALSDALQCVLCQAGGTPPFNVLYKSPRGVLRALFLVPQCYFLVVGAGTALTLPAGRALRRALSTHRRFVRCTVACSLPGRGETAHQRPLQVPWGHAPCRVPQSPALLPCYGCRARTVTTRGPRTPPCPKRTRALYPMHCSVFSAKSGRDCPSTSSTGKRRSRPAGPRHHASPRPRWRLQALRYRLQRGPVRSGIGLPLVPLEP